MTTITINLDDDLARHVEESARREHKSVSEWVKERLTPEADCAAVLAALAIPGYVRATPAAPSQQRSCLEQLTSSTRQPPLGISHRLPPPEALW